MRSQSQNSSLMTILFTMELIETSWYHAMYRWFSKCSVEFQFSVWFGIEFRSSTLSWWSALNLKESHSVLVSSSDFSIYCNDYSNRLRVRTNSLNGKFAQERKQKMKLTFSRKLLAFTTKIDNRRHCCSQQNNAFKKYSMKNVIEAIQMKLHNAHAD